MAFQVIGVGFGRTGTSSLKVALEQVGFGPCDHMAEVIKNPARAALWMEAAAAKERGEAFDWERLYADYRSTADWPGAFFWRELIAAYPEAKVILTTRDPERWYDSMRRTVYAIRHDPEVMRRVADSFDLETDLKWMPLMVDKLIFDGTFHGQFADRSRAIRIFEEHVAAVEATVPAERLLVFEAQAGWEPLCRFLGVPVPVEPYPRLNDAASMEERLRRGDGVPAAADDPMRRLIGG